MRKFLFSLILGFQLVIVAGAEELKPPVPSLPAEGADVLPPPLDLNQLTPLPLPAELPSLPAQAEPAKKEAGGTAAAAADAVMKTVNAVTATPTKAASDLKAPVPTATPIPAAEKAPAPTATPEVKKETAAPVSSTVTFADYFPTAKGTKWTYEYLKPEAGTKVKKTRTVESVAQEQIAGGIVTSTFQVTEDGKTTEEKYSLKDNQVSQTSSGSQALTGEFIFQYPSPTAAAHWTGTGKTCKASFGKAQVYKKIYPDCVIVTEKTAASTVISYYAKGIGLVAVEVYGKGLKLDSTRSFALVSK